MKLTVGYLNIEGLKMEKHQACCSLIDAGVFDILFLSETWFPKSFNYLSHPYSFIHTPVDKVNEKSRQSGGILAMASKEVLPRIASYRTTANGIFLDLDGIRLLAVYLPPSFSTDQIELALSQFDSYHVLFGDINVRFKNHSGSKQLSTRLLQDFWLDWLARHSLTIACPRTDPFSITAEHKTHFDNSHSTLLSSRFLPTVGDVYHLLSHCELDHLFCSSFIDPELELLGSKQFNLKTVHQYFLRFTLPIVHLEATLRQSFGRFRLELLEKPGIPDLLAAAWIKLDSEINWKIADIDVYDSVLVNSIQAVAEEILGIYDAFDRRKSPDKIQFFIQSQLSATAAIRLFKRKQRNTNPSLMIQSKDKKQTAMDECVSKFQSTFSTASCESEIPPLDDDSSVTSDLFAHIEPKKIFQFLKQYPRDKACGLDSIHTILLQALQSTSLFSRLSGLYQLCIVSGQTPARWNKSVMYLLPKHSNPPITCDSVRPLSILPMFRRIFESLLLPIFTDSNKSFTKLHPTQAGFRHGYSTLTHATICHHALSTKAVQYAVFLDFKSAYDAVPEYHLMMALKKRGLPVRLQHLVRSLMFRNGSFHLVINGQLSDLIRRNCGLPQGSPLSPVIFNMFIDPLCYQLNDNIYHDIPRSLFFADDVLLLCQTHYEAVHLLKIAQCWADENDMMYNVLKCGVVSPMVGNESLYLNDKMIPVVESYKYLGFLIDKKGIDFIKHIDRSVESGHAFLKFLQVQCSEWTPYTRYIVYQMFLRPQLEYGAPLIQSFLRTKKNYDSIQQLQNNAVAWIFNSSAGHIKVLEGILGVLSVGQRFSHLRCSFQLHLENTTEDNPVRSLIRSSQNLSCLRNDKLYTEFQSSSDLPSSYPELKQAMSMFLLTRRTLIISQMKSNLVHYIAKTSRTSGLVDKVLTSPVRYQRMLLAWRRGILFLLHKCVCGNPWNRGHIPCLSKVTLSIEHNMEFEKCRGEYSKNFCEVDYLLNVGEWDLVFKILKGWQVELTC